VPEHYNSQLYNWVHNQRYAWRNKHLNEERIGRLESVDFAWITPNIHQSKPAAPAKMPAPKSCKSPSATDASPAEARQRAANDENLGVGYTTYADIDIIAGKKQGQEPPFIPSWRLDPRTSFSDWTVVIEEEGGTSTTYHVHKYFLAGWTHKSDYFSKMIRSGRAESVKISLPRLAALAFIVMLDFMYGSQSGLFKDENAVPSLSVVRNRLRCFRMRL
jgi:hypothetical protein